MKFTNKLGLPQALCDAVKNDDYNRGDCDLSVTQLIKPMRAVILEERHRDEIEEDVSERLWSVYGRIVHKILENANQDDNTVVERRLFMEVDGVRISGAMDSFEIKEGRLSDWKFVTAYKFKKNEVPLEWEQQQNIYAELLRVNGHEINKLEIIGLLRDHSKLEAKRDEFYPPLPVARMEIPMWSQEKVQAFIKERVEEFKKAKSELPQCTIEERWAKPSVWAIKKKGSARAISGGLYATEQAANAALSRLGPTYEIEYRAGQNTRCENYCSASAFCQQFKKLGGK